MYVGATADLTPMLPANVSIGTNTSPWTVAGVGSLIGEVSAEIDTAVAAAGYGLPIATTATTAYARLQNLCKMGVCWQVLKSIFPDMGGPGDKVSLAADYRTAYVDGLDAIRAGSEPLIGAGLDASESVRLLPRSRSTSDTPTSTEGISLGWEP